MKNSKKIRVKILFHDKNMSKIECKWLWIIEKITKNSILRRAQWIFIIIIQINFFFNKFYHNEIIQLGKKWSFGWRMYRLWFIAIYSTSKQVISNDKNIFSKFEYNSCPFNLKNHIGMIWICLFYAQNEYLHRFKFGFDPRLCFKKKFCFQFQNNYILM